MVINVCPKCGHKQQSYNLSVNPTLCCDVCGTEWNMTGVVKVKEFKFPGKELDIKDETNFSDE